jgi:endogenous inhibitor of DNA gyrase (YacG/DUF329 family)
MRCPICARETFTQGNPFRPFCSERCKLLDLDNWLTGRYRISAFADRREMVESRPGSEETVSDNRESGG